MMTRANYKENRTPKFAVFSEDQLEIMYNAAFKTLKDTGADVHHPGARDLFKKHGCRVDGKRVRFPQELLRYAFNNIPPTTTVYDWEGNESCYIEKGKSYFGPGPTPPHFIDPDTLERRHYVRKDANSVARVCDALPNIGYVQSLGTISDVTVELADVYEFADMIQNTTKVIMNWAYTRENCADQHRIGIAMAGGEDEFKLKPNYIHYSEPISPLVSDFHAIDKCMYCAEHRIPQVYTPCSIGGATVPATHAGQILVAFSEAMVGVIASQLINPGTCVIVGGMLSILDMRHMIYAYGAPELSILSAGMTQFVQYCGLPMYSQSGCTDTKCLELQSGIEGALSVHAAMLSGANFVHDNGYTESGLCGDVFQTVFDDELIGMARVIENGIEVNEETLAVDVIKNVGAGGHFLEEDHTMKYFRKHWRPTLMDRNSYEDWETRGAKSMKDRIVEKTRDLIENYEGPISRVPTKAQSEIEKILNEAEDRVKKAKSA